MEFPAGEVPRADCPFVSGTALSAEGAFWEECSRLALRDTVTGAAPRQGTEVRLAWTGVRLLIQFDCEDAHPWAALTQRDGPLYEEEVVEVFLDPFGDAQCYFEIEINPLNTVCDLMLRRSRTGWRKEFGWHCAGLESSVARTGEGWKAFLSIPLESIAPAREGHLWRANFLRIDRPEGAPRELTAWSPTGRGTFHVPERFGEIRFAPQRSASRA